MKEIRFCKNCGYKTEHEIIDKERALYNPRGRALYKCLVCGEITSKRQLRPSSEISY